MRNPRKIYFGSDITCCFSPDDEVRVLASFNGWSGSTRYYRTFLILILNGRITLFHGRVESRYRGQYRSSKHEVKHWVDRVLSFPSLAEAEAFVSTGKDPHWARGVPFAEMFSEANSQISVRDAIEAQVAFDMGDEHRRALVIDAGKGTEITSVNGSSRTLESET